jgi:hypothetical protein
MAIITADSLGVTADASIPTADGYYNTLTAHTGTGSITLTSHSSGASPTAHTGTATLGAH